MVPRKQLAERYSRLTQAGINSRCVRVRAAEHAPRGPCRFLERRYGLTEVIERGAGVFAEGLAVEPSLPALPPPALTTLS